MSCCLLKHVWKCSCILFISGNNTMSIGWWRKNYVGLQTRHFCVHIRNWVLLLPCQKCTFTMYAWGSLNIYTIQRRSYFSMSMSVKYVIRGLFIVLTVWYSSNINYNIIIVTMLLVIKMYFVFAFIMCRWCRYIMWKLNVKIILFWYKFRYRM